MRHVLDSQDLWELVQGAEPQPDPHIYPYQVIRSWRHQNATAIVEIMQGLLPEFHSQLQHFDLASERWAHLTDRYAARDRTRCINLDHDLQQFQITPDDDLKVKLADYQIGRAHV